MYFLYWSHLRDHDPTFEGSARYNYCSYRYQYQVPLVFSSLRSLRTYGILYLVFRTIHCSLKNEKKRERKKYSKPNCFIKYLIRLKYYQTTNYNFLKMKYIPALALISSASAFQSFGKKKAVPKVVVPVSISFMYLVGEVGSVDEHDYFRI